MRQTLKDRHKQLHRSLPMPRLLTLVIMLAIMGMIFVRLRDPSTWSWFAQDKDDENPVVAENEPADGKNPLKTPPASSAKQTIIPAVEKTTAPAANEKSSAPGKATSSNPPQPGPAAVNATTPKESAALPPELTPTGPTDLDPMEQEDIKAAISVISDGNLEMTNLDMPAYFQILSWVDHQPTQLLQKRAKKDVFYNDFRKTPEVMRLQIVELKLNVRQIVRLTKPPKDGVTEPITTPDGKPIYELRGFTQESGSNLYFAIVTDPPKGMPIGISINEDVKLVGYFFKLQGYFSLQQQLDAERTGKKPVTLKAPVIIGRVIWILSPSAAETQKTPFWLLVSIGSVAIMIVVGWTLLAARRSHQRALPAIVPNPSLDPEAPTVDNWLDQAQSGRLILESAPETTARFDGAAPDDGFGNRLGNNFWENDESNEGLSTHDGHVT